MAVPGQPPGMETTDSLPDGWQVWNEDDEGRAIFVFRPDVFDTQQYPPGCLPTLYTTYGPPDRRRPPGESQGADRWHVTLFLEPEVAFDERPAFDARADAIDAAVSLAEQFARGDLDPRSAYQVPREDYLDALDDLLGIDRDD